MLRTALASTFFVLGFFTLAFSQDAVVTDAPVKVENQTPDEKIQDRIEEIFSEVEEFQEIQVKVQSGVVTVSGKVPNTKIRDGALNLIKQTDGVVLTLDQLEEDAEVVAQLSPALLKLRDVGKMLAVKLPLIGLALLTAMIFWWVAGFVYRRESWFGRLKLSSLGRELVRRLVKLALIICGVLLALEILDATAIVGAVLGAAGLAGLAIGFAFKSIVENYLAGILLSTRNPFEIGDFVEVGGDIGKVAVLTARDTVLVTLDGNHLRIPNSIIMNSKLLNYSRNPRRRFDFEIGVSCECDLNDVRALGLETLKRNPGVLQDPKPVAVIDRLGDSAVILKFFAWLDQTNHDLMKTKSEAIRLIKEGYDDAGVEMPEPIYRVLMQDSGEGAGEGGVSIPSYSTDDMDDEVTDADLSNDRTIDDQIESEQRDSKERNLLGEK